MNKKSEEHVIPGTFISYIYSAMSSEYCRKNDKCNYEKQKEQASLITHIKKSGLDIC